VTGYCEYIRNHPEDEFNRIYHDHEYGFPLHEDNLLFERFVLEINQAGLSWITILKKKDNFRRVYQNFDIDKIAAYGEKDINRLLLDPGIIRNRMKINAAIENAKQIKKLRGESGSFKNWLDAHHPRPLDEWAALFKANFVFTGREIVREFLISTGYLAGAHDEDCPIYPVVFSLNPGWAIMK
jgi:DNA-3-methyladenine glycosylase I